MSKIFKTYMDYYTLCGERLYSKHTENSGMHTPFSICGQIENPLPRHLA